MTYNALIRLASQWPLVLGSRSPRRVALLQELGIAFQQFIPAVEERQEAGEPPYAFARRMAETKALETAAQMNAGHIALGCDTIVVINDEILQKPRDEDEAFSMLSRLAGRKHVVCTALALSEGTKLLASGWELTEVFFNSVTAPQIREYIRSGEPADKAGAYGIQGMGSFLVDRINGHLDNVVGLPRTLLNNLSEKVIASLNKPPPVPS
ncbi:MAG TPA: Maf family protein [Candidatus Deferrimicrobium sp.]|nr:Maf family protein [Candidatus Deferrimicrobium sp.]